VKRLIAGIFAAGGALIAGSLWIANRSYDGLVERNYYHAAATEFAGREEEAREGFRAVLPDAYRAGRSRFAAVLSTSAGPLRGARATLAAMRISGTGSDREYALREESPGVYSADMVLPEAGEWMFSLSVDAGRIHARRRWAATAAPAAADPDDRGSAGTLRASAGPLSATLSISPWPPPAMRELSFTVDIPGHAGPAPFIDLSMRGMDMGRNRVDLVRGADGRYRGTGVAVRCPSGRKDTEATLTVPDKGKAVFRFDLAD
jgi:nitrogen fixation protein FixH